MLKWIAGILASVTAGVGVWFITQIAWPVEESVAVGQIAASARLGPQSSGGTYPLIGTFEVRNDGAWTVENCRLAFDGRRSDRFSMAPGARFEDTIRGATAHRGPTVVPVVATVTCGDYSKTLTGGTVTIGRVQNNAGAATLNSTATGTTNASQPNRPAGTVNSN